jgi:hypothetical protein
MRITRPLTYESMLQSAGKGCLICALLKSYQSTLLERLQPAELKQLCNYHGWSIAAAVTAKNAAEAFLRLLERGADAVPGGGCNLCNLIQYEEQTRLKELGRALAEPEVLEWIQTHNALCLPHVIRLASVLPANRQPDILAASAKIREATKSGLESFLGKLSRDSHSGAGVLGRAAELLFGYRGMARRAEKH